MVFSLRATASQSSSSSSSSGGGGGGGLVQQGLLLTSTAGGGSSKEVALNPAQQEAPTSIKAEFMGLASTDKLILSRVLLTAKLKANGSGWGK